MTFFKINSSFISYNKLLQMIEPMKILLTLTLFCFFSIFFVACKSNSLDTPLPATPTPDATTCMLKKISYNNHASLLAIEFTYNTAKKLVKVSKTALKLADNQIDSLEYNAKGQLTSALYKSNSNGDLEQKRIYEYDANDCLLTEKQFKNGLLEKEDWMLDFLKMPIRSKSEKYLVGLTSAVKIEWARNQVRQFVKNAGSRTADWLYRGPS